ncbi:MAG: hypothetical protein JXA67_17360 [Micromonosporaceae bacterium]|nr:hypothetical protein [Micromonosporaceae bacterium]
MTFPQLPSRLDVLVAQVLEEDGTPPQPVGGRIVFDPSAAAPRSQQHD